MPRGRTKKTPVQENTHEDQELQEQAPAAEADQEPVQESTPAGEPVPESHEMQEESAPAMPEQGDEAQERVAEAAAMEQEPALQENTGETAAHEQESAPADSQTEQPQEESAPAESQEEAVPAEQGQEPALADEQEQDGPEYENDGIEPEWGFSETDTPEWEVPGSGGSEWEAMQDQAQEQTLQESQEETVPAAAEPDQAQPPESLPEYMAENVRDGIRAFMQSFGINGHQPEDVLACVMGLAERMRGRQTAAGGYAGQQSGSPAEPPIPLEARITSLEMDGGTRAFAAVRYGDLAIRRVRVKEDGYGALSVAMPKYRQAGGWDETCRFVTADARNRMAGAVLDAYEQTLAQMQGHDFGSAYEQSEAHEQGGPEMGMSL